MKYEPFKRVSTQHSRPTPSVLYHFDFVDVKKHYSKSCLVFRTTKIQFKIAGILYPHYHRFHKQYANKNKFTKLFKPFDGQFKKKFVVYLYEYFF